jgi:UDP:flavonoid glycosyltransferase YjiC (YdhE family)
MNSVLEGLYFGIPLILIPQQIEQLLIALNIVSQGADIALRDNMVGKYVTASELRDALEKILGEPQFKKAAKSMQSSLRQTGGYRQAADEIQAYITKLRLHRS